MAGRSSSFELLHPKVQKWVWGAELVRTSDYSGIDHPLCSEGGQGPCYQCIDRWWKNRGRIPAYIVQDSGVGQFKRRLCSPVYKSSEGSY